MKNLSKLIVFFFLVGIITVANAQKNNAKGVGFTLEMKPVLQLDLISPEQINFVFDDKNKYQNGITKKKATILKVTSTVKWDLYAVGRSIGKSPNGKTFWDQEVSYGRSLNSVADIPMSLLEIKQSQLNTGAKNNNGLYSDYSQDFKKYSAGNSLYVAADGSASIPTKSDKYIAGHSGVFNNQTADYMHSGSYATKGDISSNFYYEIDYRILPGYPAIFPNAYSPDSMIAENIVSTANASAVLAGGVAGSANNSFAEPGIYTMTVQYVLLEDQ